MSRPLPVLVPPPAQYQKVKPLGETLETKQVEVPISRQCEACGGVGKWRRVTRNYLCEGCRSQPPHRLMTRSRAQQEFRLSFQDLHTAFQQKRLQMFTVKNPHQVGHKACPPCRLYYYHELMQLAKEVHGQRV